MTLVDALDLPVFTLKNSCNAGEMLSYLSAKFASHQQAFDDIYEEHLCIELRPQAEAMKKAADLLLATVETYLQGHLPKAYQHFDQAMSFYKPFLLYDDNAGMPKEFLLQRPYYRARAGGSKRFTKEEMFHIPFSKRAFANTHRFSIPGLPCLYLCNSVYVCWEELGQPAFETMQVSRFRQENLELNVLNLSQTPLRLQIQLRSFSSSRFDYSLPYHRNSISMLMTWPLIIACSLHGNQHAAPFREEYIIPQLLMQWIMQQQDVDGIKYFSNRTQQYNIKDFTKLYCYVFPPKNIGNGEYCSELCNHFSLTDPLSAEWVKLTDPHERYMIDKPCLGGQDVQQLELIRGKLMPYDETSFGKLEIFMRNLPFDHIRPGYPSI